ncbi:MAG: ABC transporter ATP-binding protein [candidate division FCPU426 bacterium]
MPEAPVLGLQDVEVSFSGQPVVRGAGLHLYHGRTAGLVGESGSGKTMTALAALGLVPFPGKVSGSIRYGGRELVNISETEYEKIRGAGISIVFQDPSQALNPVLTIGAQLLETIQIHRNLPIKEANILALESLGQLDISDPQERLKNYPHQLSGGMKQRVLLAMALVCEPDCLILDEPTTALDVTVQAQMLDLLERIQNLKKLSILLISHDIGIVSEISDEINIMYAGRIVEKAKTAELLKYPCHPYTVGLLNSIPRLGCRKQPLLSISGFPPNPAELPSGCAFHPRCPRAIDQCRTHDPELKAVGVRTYACWNPYEHD